MNALQTLLALLLALVATGSLAQADAAAGLARERLHIYLLMGQSNMAGRDTRGMLFQPSDPRILALGADGQWLVARDPIHAKIGRSAPGVGPGIDFARAMRATDPATAIGLIPTAVGGSPLQRWVKGGDLYEQALARAREAAARGVIRGVLWHQGEADAENPADAASYGERLTGMFRDLRQDLGQPGLPIVVGQLGDFLSRVRWPAAYKVRDALRRMPEALPGVGFADTAGLDHLGDELHFSADASRELGRRFATAMRTLQTH